MANPYPMGDPRYVAIEILRCAIRERRQKRLVLLGLATLIIVALGACMIIAK